ncbi:MAG: molybdate ABC transporter substrate-binding protein [Methanotrichaceae archaeon]|nr:molybdate ABC transporter substrate-binding protein [Methanotrichaceae archaeon]
MILVLMPAFAEEQDELTVFVAASLTGAFGEIGDLYQNATGETVIQNFDGSQMLRTQIENGAYADVFASANKKHMDALMAEGLMDNSSVITLLTNRMAVIVPKSNPGEINDLADLAKPGIKIVIGNSEVPVGNYARQVLDKLAADPGLREEYKTKVLDNIVSEETTVSLVVSKVALGEADAGFAYVSDVTPLMRSEVDVIEIPDENNVVAQYFIGVLRESEHPEKAQSFIDFVMSSQGSEVLARYGFAPVGAGASANAPASAAA